MEDTLFVLSVAATAWWLVRVLQSARAGYMPVWLFATLVLSVAWMSLALAEILGV